MSCGYWIRLNGYWVELPGVEKGVQVEPQRPSSAFTTVGGVRHSQAARRASRTWTLDLGNAGPGSVTALQVAAQGDGGDVLLWDESIARQNLLDPVALGARPGYPVVMCGPMPLVSLTAGPTDNLPTTTVSVELKANMTIGPGDSRPFDFLSLRPGQADALLKVALPPTPAGVELVGADLVLTAAFQVDGTINAHLASNAWVERTDPTYWDTIPAGTKLGSAPAATITTIPLGDVSAWVGTDLSLRVAQTGGTQSTFRGRVLVDPPVVRLHYAVLAQDRVFSQHLRPGAYTFGLWTDAPPGTELGTVVALNGGSTPGPLKVPTGSGQGWRYVQVGFTQQSPQDLRWTIKDSREYRLAGLMLSTLAHPNEYMSPQKTPVQARVEDPTLALDTLLPGEQGIGRRTVAIHEVGI